MKNLVFAFISLFMASTSFAQNATLGINMGLHLNTNQLEQNSESLNFKDITTEGRLGFHIGIHGLLKISKRLHFSQSLPYPNLFRVSKAMSM